MLEAGSSKTSSSKSSEGREPIIFGKQQDDDDRGSDWVATRQEIIQRTGDTRKAIKNAQVVIHTDGSPLKAIQTNTFKMPLAAVKKINDSHSKPEGKLRQPTKDNVNGAYAAEMDSAQREYTIQADRIIPDFIQHRSTRTQASSS